jgi:hypothetical protein
VDHASELDGRLGDQVDVLLDLFVDLSTSSRSEMKVGPLTFRWACFI